MAEQERPLVDRVWEFTKDISIKVSRKAEKHWKINTLRVEIASIRHRINLKYKDLGRYVYESLKSGTLDEASYKASINEFFDELSKFEEDIVSRERRIEELEQEMEAEPDPDMPPPPPDTITVEAEKADEEPVESEEQSTTATSEETEAAEDKPKAEAESGQDSAGEPEKGAEPEAGKETK